MAKKSKDLVKLTFEGPKYDDHGLEIDDLAELIAYKDLLVGTAKEVWKRKSPGKGRLQKGWLDSIEIKFYGIEAGSARVDLKRNFNFPDDQFDFNEPDEFDEAAEILQDGIEAAAQDQPLPEAMPKNVIPLFKNLGRNLGSDNQIRVKSRRRETETIYNREVQSRLANWLERTYFDYVDQIGEVRAADLDGGKFRLRLDNGDKPECWFHSEQETTVTNALEAHATLRLRVIGKGEFNSDSGKLAKIIEVSDISVIHSGEKTTMTVCRRSGRQFLRSEPKSRMKSGGMCRMIWRGTCTSTCTAAKKVDEV